MGMTGPSVLFGAIAKNTDWAGLGYECGAPTDKCDEGDVGYPLCTEHTPTKVVLPLALQYLTPKAVAFFGLGRRLRCRHVLHRLLHALCVHHDRQELLSEGDP